MLRSRIRTVSAAPTVLRRLNADIKEGEFVSIMGPSGAGKSTLLHILGMHDSAWSGEYCFMDRVGCRAQNIRPPIGTSRSGTSSTTSPSPSGRPSVRTSDMYGPICFGGKFTTATTSRFSRSCFA
jgi:energy-coupling factor transporter ATP-binding protein EcfA2